MKRITLAAIAGLYLAAGVSLAGESLAQSSESKIEEHVSAPHFVSALESHSPGDVYSSGFGTMQFTFSFVDEGIVHIYHQVLDRRRTREERIESSKTHAAEYKMIESAINSSNVRSIDGEISLSGTGDLLYMFRIDKPSLYAPMFIPGQGSKEESDAIIAKSLQEIEPQLKATYGMWLDTVMNLPVEGTMVYFHKVPNEPGQSVVDVVRGNQHFMIPLFGRHGRTLEGTLRLLQGYKVVDATSVMRWYGSTDGLTGLRDLLWSRGRSPSPK